MSGSAIAPPNPSPQELLAYEQAVRALDTQVASYDELRSRVGSLLTASSVVVAFLGGQALGATRELGFLAVLGLLSFGGCVTSVIAILWPVKDGVVFTLNAEKILAIWDQGKPGSEQSPHRRLATDMQGYWQKKKQVLRKRFQLFQLACLFLGLRQQRGRCS